jgi:hypothetical protein
MLETQSSNGNYSSETDVETKTRRNQALKTLLKPGEMAWRVAESYDPFGPSWRVDIVRLGKEGRWMRQRFKYDIPTGIVYFFGESALSDEEVSVLRRQGTLFRKEEK